MENIPPQSSNATKKMFKLSVYDYTAIASNQSTNLTIFY